MPRAAQRDRHPRSRSASTPRICRNQAFARSRPRSGSRDFACTSRDRARGAGTGPWPSTCSAVCISDTAATRIGRHQDGVAGQRPHRWKVGATYARNGGRTTGGRPPDTDGDDCAGAGRNERRRAVDRIHGRAHDRRGVAAGARSAGAQAGHPDSRHGFPDRLHVPRHLPGRPAASSASRSSMSASRRPRGSRSTRDSGTASTPDRAAASNDDGRNAWYEADFYGAATFQAGNWKPGALFTSYTSPNDAFNRSTSWPRVLAYDDSGNAFAAESQGDSRVRA